MTTETNVSDRPCVEGCPGCPLCRTHVTSNEWASFERFGSIESRLYEPGDEADPCISFSLADLNRTSLAGGRIARNPENGNDQWYIAADYFAKHYRPAAETNERQPKIAAQIAHAMLHILDDWAEENAQTGEARVDIPPHAWKELNRVIDLLGGGDFGDAHEVLHDLIGVNAAEQTEGVRVQACRPEDRAMLQTEAGQELLKAAIDTMHAEKTCAKHGPHPQGECPQCDELAEARSIVATAVVPSEKAGDKP